MNIHVEIVNLRRKIIVILYEKAIATKRQVHIYCEVFLILPWFCPAVSFS